MLVLRPRCSICGLGAGLLAMGLAVLAHSAAAQQPSFLPPGSRPASPNTTTTWPPPIASQPSVPNNFQGPASQPNSQTPTPQPSYYQSSGPPPANFQGPASQPSNSQTPTPQPPYYQSSGPPPANFPAPASPSPYYQPSSPPPSSFQSPASQSSNLQAPTSQPPNYPSSGPPPWVGGSGGVRTPPPSAPARDSKTSSGLGFGVWEEGRGKLWQTLHESEPGGRLQPQATLPATLPTNRSPNSLEPRPGEGRYPGKYGGYEDWAAAQPNPLRESQGGQVDPPSWQRANPQSPPWSTAQTQPPQSAMAPSQTLERGPNLSPYPRGPQAFNTTSPYSQPPAAASPSAPPTDNTAHLDPSREVPGGASSLPPGYTPAQSSPLVASAPDPEIAQQAGPEQRQTPTEDSSLKIQQLRQQYQIGVRPLRYMGSHDLSAMSDAPRWTGSTGSSAQTANSGSATGVRTPTR